MSADSPLIKFLSEHRVGKSADVSMTAMEPFQGGRWYINESEYPKFLDLLHEWLFVQNHKPLTLVEKRMPDGRTPLLIDLDFKYSPDKSLKHSFGKEHIVNFVSSVAGCVAHFFELKDKKFIRFFVTLRPQAYSPGKSVIKVIKDGVHIASPDIILTSEQQKIVREYLLGQKAVATAFAGTGFNNAEENIFDQTLTDKQGWQFYGESKKDVEHPYELAYILKYNPKTGKISDEKVDLYDSRTLMDLMSIRYEMGSKEVAKIKPESSGEYEEIYDKLNAVNTVVNPVVANDIGILPGSWQAIAMESTQPESDIEKARKLVSDCLSVKRADDFHNWMKVGWCIRNIDPTIDGFNLWMEFSKKSSKFKENDVDRLRRDWNKGSMTRSYESRGLDYGSLVRWAKEDNIEKYNQIDNEDILKYIQKIAFMFRGGTHHHIAVIMHKIFGDTYKCSVENKGHEWFRFMENVWEPLPQGLELKGKMSNIVADRVSEARQSYKNRNKAKINQTQQEEDSDNKNCMMLLKLEENLFNANYKENVLKECVQVFYDEQFSQKMNMNPFLVGCANGIINLRAPVLDDSGKIVDYKVEFRQGRPDDYVSFLAGKVKPELDPLDYVEYNPDDPEVKELLEFFEKLFPDADVREYVLTLASSCLEGQNREQCYYIMTGVGGNGKSKFVDLMRNTFGEYVSSLSTTALTRKRPDSGSANPDIINIKNKRFICMQEPDEREQLNTARMKQFSGEDIVEARGLFKDQDQFKITGKFFMSCNRLPPIHSMDDGTWRRIRVIPFKSRFVTASDPSINPENNVYPRDPFLDDKLKRWRVTFLGLMVHYYKTKYMKDGIKSVPKEVKKFSDEYKQSYDSFAKFRDARVRDVSTAKAERRAGLMEHSCVFKNIRSTYRSWAQDSSVGSKVLSENELRIRCHDAFGTPADGKTFKGVRLFNSDEEVEGFDAGIEE